MQTKGQDKPFAHSDYADYYLIENSVKKDESGLYIQGWVKIIAQEGKEEGFRNQEISRRKKLGLSISGYKDYSYTMLLYKVDCKTSRIMTLSTVSYSTTGDVIFQHTIVGPEWGYMVPNSVGESIGNEICMAAIFKD